jgi:hypothetical protein
MLYILAKNGFDGPDGNPLTLLNGLFIFLFFVKKSGKYPHQLHLLFLPWVPRG